MQWEFSIKFAVESIFIQLYWAHLNQFIRYKPIFGRIGVFEWQEQTKITIYWCNPKQLVGFSIATLCLALGSINLLINYVSLSKTFTSPSSLSKIRCNTIGCALKSPGISADMADVYLVCNSTNEFIYRISTSCIHYEWMLHTQTHTLCHIRCYYYLKNLMKTPLHHQ